MSQNGILNGSLVNVAAPTQFKYDMVYQGNAFPEQTGIFINNVWSGCNVSLYDTNNNLITSFTVPMGNIGAQGWSATLSFTTASVQAFLVITQNLSLLKSPSDNPVLFQSGRPGQVTAFSSGDRYSFFQVRATRQPPIAEGQQPATVDGVSTLLNSNQIYQAFQEGKDVEMQNSTTDLGGQA